jgi:hypothetical protein
MRRRMRRERMKTESEEKDDKAKVERKRSTV